MTKAAKFVLSRMDRSILNVVQQNNQFTHAQIGERVNLSPSSVRRHLLALRTAGIIRADVSLVDPSLRGLSFLVQVWCHSVDRQKDAAFRKAMENDPHVSQCYSVSGEYDYMLMAHSSSPEEFETWAEYRLMDQAAVSRYKSTLVWSQIKHDHLIDFTDADRG